MENKYCARVGYEMVKHPKHYNMYSKEFYDIVAGTYGEAALALWCEITGMKYRYRMGLKPGNSIEQDLAKEREYLNKRDSVAHGRKIVCMFDGEANGTCAKNGNDLIHLND